MQSTKAADDDDTAADDDGDKDNDKNEDHDSYPMCSTTVHLTHVT